MDLDPGALVGYFVTEVGVRQAWPFVTFTTNDGDVTPAEVRLYLDTTCDVSPAPPFALAVPDDDPAAALPALLTVLDRTVFAATVTGEGDLVVGFEGDVALRVSGHPSRWTTHDVWWLAAPRA